MTSLLRKKLQITVPNSQLCQTTDITAGACCYVKHTLLDALRDSLPTKTAWFGGLLLGMISASSADAQQSNGWSPQPYSKPSVEAMASTQATVPVNDLRASEAPKNGQVVRWGKAMPQSKPEYNQQFVIRQPAVSQEPSPTGPIEPRTGFGRPASTRLQVEHAVQFASHNESTAPVPVPVPVKKTPSGTWHSKETAQAGITVGTVVQQTKYQEPKSNLSEPFFPEAMPPIRGLQQTPPLQDRGSDSNQGQDANPSQPARPNRSLLDKEEIRTNPFNGSKKPRDFNADRSPSDDQEPPPMGSKEDRDLAPPPPIRRENSGVDCDAIRLSVKDFDINKIAIDSSPDFVKGLPNPLQPRPNSKESSMASAERRTWLNYDGQVVAEGKMVDMRLGSVIIEKEDGTRTSYLLHKLCDADQAYVSEKWGLPVTCAIDDRSFPSRDFVDSVVTWKASGACHKPLYFEDVQLERYGHEWGPIAQPVISTAHFFGNVLVLPYKMGIHPMNECQYALGHYRPGNCAPWTVGPVPISLRGALLQAKVVTGAVLILP